MARTRLLAVVAAALLAAAAAPAGAAPRIPQEVFTGVRPGVPLVIGGSLCTAGFVFQTSGNAFDPSQQLYLSTGAHCVDNVGQAVAARVVNPVTGSREEIAVGTVALIGTADVALVAIDPAWNSWVSPTVVYWGGPTGVDTTAAAGTPVRCVGHPLGAPDIPRAGVVLSRTTDWVTWSCPTIEGDSGGPVTSAGGLALAAVYGIVDGNAGPPVHAGAGGQGPSIQTLLAIGGKPLATCASAIPWPDPGCPA
jgi:hypothetical protein